jgi:hypothetical protein
LLVLSRYRDNTNYADIPVMPMSDVGGSCWGGDLAA